MADLTTTSYAILGLLAIKPWTTYELAQQMERALNDFWPRTRSKLYEEPKKLVAHGMARATAESVGKRPRTVYSITPKGRRALAAWVATPPVAPGPSLEFEHLVKVFFAEFGSKADLLATIGGLREWLLVQTRIGAEVAGSYVDGPGPFPDRLPWILLVGEFLDRFNMLVADWSAWAAEAVEAWPDDITKATPDLATLQHMYRRNQRAVAQLSQR